MRKYLCLMLLVSVFLLNGCAVIFQSGRRSDTERIKSLEDELENLRRARSSLEDKLSQEIKDNQVSVSMQDKGLVITFVAEVLFDSGKAILKPQSLPILDKVAGILNEEVAGNDIGIEGHTDNEPIRHSSWKSNWELSSHRALSVLYYLESRNVNSERLSAIGYGEYRPVMSNDTTAGKQKNRRVEIVILAKGKIVKNNNVPSGIEEEELK